MCILVFPCHKEWSFWDGSFPFIKRLFEFSRYFVLFLVESLAVFICIRGTTFYTWVHFSLVNTVCSLWCIICIVCPCDDYLDKVSPFFFAPEWFPFPVILFGYQIVWLGTAGHKLWFRHALEMVIWSLGCLLSVSFFAINIPLQDEDGWSVKLFSGSMVCSSLFFISEWFIAHVAFYFWMVHCLYLCLPLSLPCPVCTVTSVHRPLHVLGINCRRSCFFLQSQVLEGGWQHNTVICVMSSFLHPCPFHHIFLLSYFARLHHPLF